MDDQRKRDRLARYSTERTMRVLNAEASFLRGLSMAAAILLLVCTGFAQAQSDDTQSNAANDPPARVARLSYEAGDLGMMPAGTTQWTAADVNRPLTNGDKLSSGPDAKAELELGGGALRINNRTDIGVLNLTDQTGQFELTQGTLNITVRNIEQGATYEIDTPTLALVVNQPGSFRVDVPADGSSTTVNVIDGVGMIYGENSAQRDVYSGRSYVFADSSLTNVTVSELGGSDAFDNWCNERDSEYANEATSSAQYVSDDTVGAQDLAAYGTWEDDGDYGPIWYPGGVAVSWAPYTFGHWVWIPPWGWTWVDGLPWGFAPYHYGRWAYVHGHWGWLPGPPRVRPVYAPALVAFAGLGRGGPVGWFPLGPRDIYNPWYHVSRNYYTNVNATNVAIRPGFTQDTLFNNIHNQYGFYQSGRTPPGLTYANRNVPHAFTSVSAETFASARNVQANQIRLNPQQSAAATVMTSADVQRPTPASFGQPRAANTRPLPAAGFNRQVVAVGVPAAQAMTTASVRAGLPASNVHVMGAHPGVVANSPRLVTGASYSRPATAPASTPPIPHPGNLPQVPRFESAQQVQQPPPSSRYAPPQRAEPQQGYAQPQNVEQERYQAAERAHEYVPEQRQVEQYRPESTPQPYDSYRAAQPEYRPAPYAPEQRSEPQPQSHPQSAPRSAPAPSHASGNNNQH
jgi:hypothetical protein